MAIGERIHFFRLRNNLTMNGLGQLLGFHNMRTTPGSPRLT